MARFRFLTFIALFTLICQIAFSQNKKETSSESQIRKYWFVMLIKGEQRSQDSVSSAKIQEGHMANITKLYNDGKIKVAGPFGDDSDWRGLFIFDCVEQSEVEKLLKEDPAISSGRLRYEIHPWYTAPMGSFIPGKPKKTL